MIPPVLPRRPRNGQAFLVGHRERAELAELERHAAAGPARGLAVRGRSRSSASRLASGIGPLLAGIEKLGVRWKTVSCAACAAMIGIDWMAEEPVPITRDALAGEVDALVRPAAGEVHLAREAIGALDVDLLRHRQAAGGHDVEAARDLVARGRCARCHAATAVVPHCALDPGRELDVAAEVVLVGDVLRVAEDLRLRRRTSPTTSTSRRAPDRTSTSSQALDVAAGARDTGSSTTCRRRRRRPR